MPKRKQPARKVQLEKATHAGRPEWAYAIPPAGAAVQRIPRKKVLRGCDRPCTATVTLLPKQQIQPGSGIGWFLFDVDGWRAINAYVISDALFSSNGRGFALELSFSLDPFVCGVGTTSETFAFYDFHTYVTPAQREQGTLVCRTSDRLASGYLPWIGGTHLAHILRVPVMGPYVRASAFNEDSVAHDVEVRAYLST
jgi:hypothetical protein